MPKYSLPTRIRLELVRRLKYLVFMTSGRSRARRIVTSLTGIDRPLFVTIAFNDPSLVRAQIEEFARECREDAEFLVADNSPSRELGEIFKSSVKGTEATYVRLPRNLYTHSRGAAQPGRGSLSHSVALNWVWRYVVQPLNPPSVVLLDHDVFPLKSFSVAAILENHRAAGPKRQGTDRWTTWPGLTFLRYRDLPNKKLSFTPSGDLDSGAGLWESLYRYMSPEDVRFMPHRFIDVLDGPVEVKSNLELIDDSWLHLIDGSGWFDGVGKLSALGEDRTRNARLPDDVRVLLDRLNSRA